MPNVNNEMPTSAEHSFGFADEPIDDDAFGDIFIDTGGFDDNGNWEEGTGKAIDRSATKVLMHTSIVSSEIKRLVYSRNSQLMVLARPTLQLRMKANNTQIGLA